MNQMLRYSHNTNLVGHEHSSLNNVHLIAGEISKLLIRSPTSPADQKLDQEITLAQEESSNMVVEPLSTLMLINASLGIARSLVHTIQELYELAEQYETAALGIRTVATQCNTFRIAIQRINDWLTKQDETTRQNLDEDFWQALADNLDTGKLVIEDLEKRIKGLKKDAAKFWTRTKYLWNSTVIAELQSQIQGLMSALGILIQVIEM